MPKDMKDPDITKGSAEDIPTESKQSETVGVNFPTLKTLAASCLQSITLNCQNKNFVKYPSDQCENPDDAHLDKRDTPATVQTSHQFHHDVKLTDNFQMKYDKWECKPEKQAYDAFHNTLLNKTSYIDEHTKQGNIDEQPIQYATNTCNSGTACKTDFPRIENHNSLCQVYVSDNLVNPSVNESSTEQKVAEQDYISNGQMEMKFRPGKVNEESEFSDLNDEVKLHQYLDSVDEYNSDDTREPFKCLVTTDKNVKNKTESGTIDTANVGITQKENIYSRRVSQSINTEDTYITLSKGKSMVELDRYENDEQDAQKDSEGTKTLEQVEESKSHFPCRDSSTNSIQDNLDDPQISSQNTNHLEPKSKPGDVDMSDQGNISYCLNLPPVSEKQETDCVKSLLEDICKKIHVKLNVQDLTENKPDGERHIIEKFVHDGSVNCQRSELLLQIEENCLKEVLPISQEEVIEFITTSQLYQSQPSLQDKQEFPAECFNAVNTASIPVEEKLFCASPKTQLDSTKLVSTNEYIESVSKVNEMLDLEVQRQWQRDSLSTNQQLETEMKQRKRKHAQNQALSDKDIISRKQTCKYNAEEIYIVPCVKTREENLDTKQEEPQISSQKTNILKPVDVNKNATVEDIKDMDYCLTLPSPSEEPENKSSLDFVKALLEDICDQINLKLTVQDLTEIRHDSERQIVEKFTEDESGNSQMSELLLAVEENCLKEVLPISQEEVIEFITASHFYQSQPLSQDRQEFIPALAVVIEADLICASLKVQLDNIGMTSVNDNCESLKAQLDSTGMTSIHDNPASPKAQLDSTGLTSVSDNYSSPKAQIDSTGMTSIHDNSASPKAQLDSTGMTSIHDNPISPKAQIDSTGLTSIHDNPASPKAQLDHTGLTSINENIESGSQVNDTVHCEGHRGNINTDQQLETEIKGRKRRHALDQALSDEDIVSRKLTRTDNADEIQIVPCVEAGEGKIDTKCVPVPVYSCDAELYDNNGSLLCQTLEQFSQESISCDHNLNESPSSAEVTLPKQSCNLVPEPSFKWTCKTLESDICGAALDVEMGQEAGLLPFQAHLKKSGVKRSGLSRRQKVKPLHPSYRMSES